jgi:hypothetical protein
LRGRREKWKKDKVSLRNLLESRGYLLSFFEERKGEGEGERGEREREREREREKIEDRVGWNEEHAALSSDVLRSSNLLR